MTVVLILLVILATVALLTYLENRSRGAQPAVQLPPAPSPLPEEETRNTPDVDGTEALILRLPEPARAQAWGLLCGVADAQRAGQADTRTAYLLNQTRRAYLPDTLRAYLNLSGGARRLLAEQGQIPEVLLGEQLRLMEDGVREALRHDHASADRLLSQGRFLRERFGGHDSDLTLPQPGRRTS